MHAFRTPKVTVLLALLTVTATALVLTACFLPDRAAALEKGILEVRLQNSGDPVERAAIARQIGAGLGARWARVNINWGTLEAKRGAYSEAYLERLDATVDALAARHVKVIITTYSMPVWAQDRYWWTHPPAGYDDGPQSFYAIREGALPDYANLGQFLATHFAGRVHALESWNEPNLWSYIYPQRTADDGFFGPRTYLRMLRAYRTGIKRAHTGVKVVAGATAPVGLDDRYRTSPQRFARFLKANGAAKLFDAYSHHPYVPGGTFFSAPDQPPNNFKTTVTLYNLRTLLRIFPGKPFYLTEYGYNTRYSADYGGFYVSEATQARYVRRAFVMARRHPQVKVMIWYLLYDARADGTPAEWGVYTGLRRLGGARKPAWYAFRAVR
jgi:hypothetical protein